MRDTQAAIRSAEHGISSEFRVPSSGLTGEASGLASRQPEVEASRLARTLAPPTWLARRLARTLAPPARLARRLARTLAPPTRLARGESRSSRQPGTRLRGRSRFGVANARNPELGTEIANPELQLPRLPSNVNCTASRS